MSFFRRGLVCERQLFRPNYKNNHISIYQIMFLGENDRFSKAFQGFKANV
jgi:hypothetical protein